MATSYYNLDFGFVIDIAWRNDMISDIASHVDYIIKVTILIERFNQNDGKHWKNLNF